MNKKALINYFNKYGLQFTKYEFINDEYFSKARFIYFDNDNIKLRVAYDSKYKEYSIAYLQNNNWYIGFSRAYNMWDFKYKFKDLLTEINYFNKLI